MPDSSALKQAGHFELLSFKVTNFERTKTVDITRLIHMFNIDESMSAGSVRGTAMVYDALNILSEFPLVGEETIEIVYTDFFDNKRQESYFLYAITDVSNDDENSGKIQRYKINFVSVSKFYSEDYSLMKTYRPNTTSSTISDYVKEVYEEYYERPLIEARLSIKPKPIVIESTDGPQSYVIPNYTPEQTMHFFARRGYNATSTTQLFRFFENRDKFYFVTNEYMANVAKNFIGTINQRLAAAANITPTTIPIFRLNYMPNLTADRQEMAMYNLIDINYGERVNTVSDMNSGAYKRNTYEIDLIHGVITPNQYDHLEVFNESNQKLIHSKRFVDQYVTKESEKFVIKDYAAPGATRGRDLRLDQHYSTLYNYKKPNLYHYRKNQIEATIYGRNNIVAGSIIDLEINSAKPDVVVLDKEKSGRYIVESVSNVFFENTYRQKLVLSRGGIGT